MTPETPARPLVLVVDDEPALADVLSRHLRMSLGVDVVTAHSGEEALRVLAERDAHVLVTDHQMPGMTGLDLLERAHAVAPTAARVMITAYPDVDLTMTAVNEGRVRALLAKPFRPSELANAVLDALADRARRLERRRLSDPGLPG